MKLSDLELSAYDLAAIILPGAIGIAEVQITRKGIIPFWDWVSGLSLSGSLFLAILSFALGHIISQAAYEGSRIFGLRAHKKPRDDHWKNNGRQISQTLKDRHQIEVDFEADGSCDRAFNVCLTLIGDSFEKRKVFSFVAALSMSLWLLSIAALVPVVHLIWTSRGGLQSPILVMGTGTLACVASSWLSWRRSQLYFNYADTTVFDIFEAAGAAKVTAVNEPLASEE